MRIVATLPFVLLLNPSAAQSQAVRGVVVEDSTRMPIAGVSVELLHSRGPAQTVLTDGAGMFLFFASRPGEVALRLSHVGYTRLDSVPLLLRPGEGLELELRLSRRALALEPLLVTARVDSRLGGYRERLRRGGPGRFITREQIDQRLGATATDLLSGIHDVSLERLPFPNRGNMISMRGMVGYCSPTVYIDGVHVPQPVDVFLLPSSLEGVEIYTRDNAPRPIQTRSDTPCGVVAFWTRPYEAGHRFSLGRIAAFAGVIALTMALTLAIAH